MSLSVYEATVPVMTHGLHVLERYLDHAQSLERAKEMPTGQVLAARLAPDMLSFGEQISVNCNKAEAHLSQLARRPRPSPRSVAMTYPGLSARLAETREFLNGLQPEELVAAQTHTYELSPPIAHGWFGGDDYIRHLVLPDFFFHVAVAHGILRHLGAPIGKRDYLGNLDIRSGGYA